MGAGKTAFVRDLFDGLHEAEAFKQYMEYNSKKGKLPIFTSYINAESKLHVLNGWRPILQMMLCYHCKKNEHRQKREHFIAECILRSGNEDKSDLICEIFGIN